MERRRATRRRTDTTSRSRRRRREQTRLGGKDTLTGVIGRPDPGAQGERRSDWLRRRTGWFWEPRASFSAALGRAQSLQRRHLHRQSACRQRNAKKRPRAPPAFTSTLIGSTRREQALGAPGKPGVGKRAVVRRPDLILFRKRTGPASGRHRFHADAGMELRYFWARAAELRPGEDRIEVMETDKEFFISYVLAGWYRG